MKLNQEPIDLALLKSFVAIAETKSFQGAADKIGRSPSAISMQVKRLEETLGVEVFTRNARETHLTRDGQRLLGYARNLLSSEMEMRNAFDLEPVVGQIVLGVPDDVIERFPMRVLREFSDQFPGVSVSIKVDHTPSLLKLVERGAIDIAIVTYVDTIAGIEKSEVFYQEAEVWAVRKGSQIEKQTPLPITLWDEGWGWYQRTKEILDQSDTDYQIVLYTENITARKNAIEAGLCVGPLPISQLGENLTSVPSLMALDALPTYALAIAKGDTPSKAAQLLEGYLREEVAY